MNRWGWTIGLCLCLAATSPGNQDSALFYGGDVTGAGPKAFEARVLGGHDFSNPYLGIYSAGARLSWLAHPSFSPGVELTKYGSSRRSGVQGAGADTLGPDWQAAAVLRVVPIMGLMNLFSSYVIAVDIALVGKAGAMRYTGSPLGTTLGGGLELGFGFNSNWGMTFAASWEEDKLPGRPWQSRVGFRVGPTVRF